MLDISISKTKVNGRPKGRPGEKPNKHSDQIVYPNRTIPTMTMKITHWVPGDFYRKTKEMKDYD